MTPEHRLAIQLMDELGMSRAAIVKDPGWYLDDAPSMGDVKSVLRKRRNKIHSLTLDGKTMGISDWAREKGISRKTIHERLRQGWTEEEALTTPVKTPSQDFRKKEAA